MFAEPWSPDNWKEQYLARKARLNGSGRRSLPRPAPPPPEPKPAVLRARDVPDEASQPVRTPMESLLSYKPGHITIAHALAALAERPIERPIQRAAEIISVVSAMTGVQQRDLRGTSRRAHIVIARQFCMWSVKKITGRSLPEVGRLMGNRDHTTVLHAVRKIEGLLGACGSIKALVDHVIENSVPMECGKGGHPWRKSSGSTTPDFNVLRLTSRLEECSTRSGTWKPPLRP